MNKKIQIDKSSVKFLMGIDNPEQLLTYLSQNSHKIGIALIGRSNVGKSSLINALFGSKTARVSKTPGRTRQVNIFEFTVTEKNITETFFLFDLPGYGHADVSKEMSHNWDQLMEIFFSRLSTRNLLINIQDARHPRTEADKKLAKFLKSFEQEVILAFNKIDKLKTQSEKAALKKLLPDLAKTYKWCSQIFYVSAEKKTGINELEDALINFLVKTQTT
jgi:GTP-binding protein